jgi:5'-3' exonuclease
MIVHLIDGTYELYRQHFGQVARHSTPSPVAATGGVLNSTLQLLANGATHVAVSIDKVIESFRNDLWDGYKDSTGMEPVLFEQLPFLEEALVALGVAVWPMLKYEADDALAAGAALADQHNDVQQVQILTPDKDLGQCVRGNRVVQFDRRNELIINEDAVREKYSVSPASIADWLGLVGDSADGFPGLQGWGAKSASAVLSVYKHIEDIPLDASAWANDSVTVRGAAKLASTLADNYDDALLFKKLATLITDVSDDVRIGSVEEWKWQGPTSALASIAQDVGNARLVDRADEIASRVNQ